MFYYLCQGYFPNTANINRVMSFIKGFDELGVKMTLVFFMPDNKKSTMSQEYGNVRVNYMWKNYFPKLKILRWLYYWLSVNRFAKNLKYGDIVFCYGMSDSIHRFIGKKGVKVYLEKTEHPLATPLGTKYHSLSIEEHLNTCSKLDGLFVISHPLKLYYASQGIKGDKIFVINMTVDSNRFDEINKSKKVDRYIAYCGTATNNKDGVDELIKSFALVAEEIDDVKLYIIGRAPGKNDEGNNLQLVKELGIEQRVVFRGLVSADCMPQILKDAEVLALDRPDSLQAKHGFPTKLGEYLMTGNPVVVTKVGDIPRFLKDGESALLSDERNPRQFADKLIWALNHPQEASIIGQNGKKVAIENFNYLIETNKIVNVIFGSV